jgi:hypothetical protein
MIAILAVYRDPAHDWIVLGHTRELADEDREDCGAEIRHSSDHRQQ